MDLVSPVVARWLREAASSPEHFWSRAAEELPWFRKWDRVFDDSPPTFRWYVGAQTNISYNCLDYHVARGWGGHAALIYQNERGEQRTFTYAQLLEQVKQTAASLRSLGISKGDRIAIYMPT